MEWVRIPSLHPWHHSYDQVSLVCTMCGKSWWKEACGLGWQICTFQSQFLIWVNAQFNTIYFSYRCMIYDSMSSSESVSWPKNRGWIKVNVNQTGFYRVNYELANWWRLTEHLKQSPNSEVDQCMWHTNTYKYTHTTHMYICTHLSYTCADMHSVLLGIFFFPQVLTPADRAGLLDDVFALSRCVHSCYRVVCGVVCMHCTCTTWIHCCCHCKHTHVLITFIIYTPFLCSAGHLGVVTAFNLSSYLEGERHYLPWSVTLSWMHTIGERLSLTLLYGKYKVHYLPFLLLLLFKAHLNGISLVNRILHVTVSCACCPWRRS